MNSIFLIFDFFQMVFQKRDWFGTWLILIFLIFSILGEWVIHGFIMLDWFWFPRNYVIWILDLSLIDVSILCHILIAILFLLKTLILVLFFVLLTDLSNSIPYIPSQESDWFHQSLATCQLPNFLSLLLFWCWSWIGMSLLPFCPLVYNSSCKLHY